MDDPNQYSREYFAYFVPVQITTVCLDPSYDVLFCSTDRYGGMSFSFLLLCMVRGAGQATGATSTFSEPVHGE